MKKEADRDDLQIQEIKKTITIENYFSLTLEHRMQKDQIQKILKNAERQQEIIEELRKKNEEMKVTNDKFK